jgi:ketosteroid isomerase-like protein
MSQENVKVENAVVRRWFWAFENDTEAFRDTLHPAIAWFPIEEDRTPSYGVDAAVRNRNQWLDAWDAHRFDLEQLVEEGDSVVVAVRITARGKGSGVEVDLRFYAHFKLHEGKVIYIFDHEDRTAALEAVGLGTGTVSRENLEAARRLYEARNRGDVEGVIAECHPQVEVFPHLSSLGGVPVRGHDGLRTYLRSLAEEWEEFRHDPEHFFDAGDKVVAFLHTHARGRGSGIEVDVAVAHVLTFEGGLCVRNVTYLDRAQAMEAAGLHDS